MTVLGDAHVVPCPGPLHGVVQVEDGAHGDAVLTVLPDVGGLRVTGDTALHLGGHLTLHHLDEEVRHHDLLWWICREVERACESFSSSF